MSKPPPSSSSSSLSSNTGSGKKGAVEVKKRDGGGGGERERMEPLPPIPDHNPRVLGSWARRTGFKSNNASGESSEIAIKGGHSNNTSQNPMPSQDRPKKSHLPPGGVGSIPGGGRGFALEKSDGGVAQNGSILKAESNPSSSNTLKPLRTPPGRKGSPTLAPAPAPVHAPAPPILPISRTRMETFPPPPPSRSGYKEPDSVSLPSDDSTAAKQSHMKYEIRETPGIVSIVLYGMQHYISMLGSLVLIPLILVPAMGGNDEDTANVVSNLLFVTGLSTLLHSFFGSRLPLIQGASFVYLAPALAIINAPEFSTLSDNRFKETMRELQGAIIVSSIFQFIIGYSGLMSLLLRYINPVVVAPTIVAIGLSFFGYAFPIVGTCVEIGIPQIGIIVIFGLYLRRVSIFGHRVFQVYAVPMGLVITWIYAFLLTANGVYTYKGCEWNSPNISSDACQTQVYNMKHCQTDTSSAIRSAAWISFPYPLQWGIPIFRYKTGIIMVVISIIASVDSVGTYHASSLLVASGAPTPGVVSRGIGLEGVTTAIAGLWGVGTGVTTLTENVHTIAVTKIGSRRVVEFGAGLLMVLSIFGKVGAFITSIPQVIVAALLCIMWAMLAALGLSNLRYSETGSSRNVIIVGVSLYLSLSIPAYFQQYGVSPSSVATITSYLQPYIVAQHGPFQTNLDGLNFALNTLLSTNVVIAFMVAFILDNTVPGTYQERGVYVWSEAESARNEPTLVKDYGMPWGLRRIFKWVRWVGL